jgi:hypothetical protein
MTDAKTIKTRELLTAAELRLIESSRGQALVEATQAQLKKKITLARKLRDKWREVFDKQRRKVQWKQGGRTSADNVRSRQKSAQFAKALAQFEARLEELAASPALNVSTKRSAGKELSKRKRVQGHRLIRSFTRDQLRKQRDALEVKGTP